MLNYIAAENLKQKNTFAKKLIWLAPIITILLNVFAPIWYQQNSYNWWYILLHTGLVTLLCTLVMQRDSGKLKYRAIFPLPINLEKVWYGKIFLCSIYMIVSNVLFMVLNLVEYSNAIVHDFQKFRAPFSGKIVHIFPEQSAVI